MCTQACVTVLVNAYIARWHGCNRAPSETIFERPVQKKQLLLILYPSQTSFNKQKHRSLELPPALNSYVKIIAYAH